MRTLMTLEEFNSEKIELSEFNQKRIKEAKDLAAEVAPLFPCFIMVMVDIEDGKTYFERIIVYLEKAVKGIQVEINKITYPKPQYQIFSNDSYRLPYITMADKVRQEKSVNLNKIGKLSKAKIESYLLAIAATHHNLKQMSEERVNNVKKFREDLAASGLEVREWRKGEGYTERNGLEYHFKINDNGYIDERIKYTGEGSLAAFLQVSK